jgi:hypothetical protein
MADEENALERDRKVKKSLGISPALVGAAAYEGLPRMLSPMLSGIPHGLSDLLASGKTISSEGDTPLRKITEFTRAEVKAIQNFAAESGVKAPIVTGLDPDLRKLKSGYFYGGESFGGKLSRLAQGLIGKKDIPVAAKSHIGLATTSMPQAFHEIGHASDIKGSRTARNIVHELGGHLGDGMAGTALRYGIAGQVLAPPDEESSGLRQAVYKYAPALVGATYVPELAEELRASTRAVRGARKHGVGALKALAELAPAFGTYAGHAAAPVLATILAKKIVQALHAKREAEGREQEKTSAAKVKSESAPKASGILRSTANSAWQVGGKTPPKPKSIKPNTHELGDPAKTRMAAKPPSNKAYHKDMLESLYNPSRGFRQSVVA